MGRALLYMVAVSFWISACTLPDPKPCDVEGTNAWRKCEDGFRCNPDTLQCEVVSEALPSSQGNSPMVDAQGGDSPLGGQVDMVVASPGAAGGDDDSDNVPEAIVEPEVNSGPCPAERLVVDALGVSWLCFEGESFVMGYGEEPASSPEHTRTVNTFWLARTEMTYATYKGCVDAQYCGDLSVHDGEAWYGLVRDGLTMGAERPVTHLTLAEVEYFLDWYSAEVGGVGRVRLPSEAEWEFAARVDSGTLAIPSGREGLNSCTARIQPSNEGGILEECQACMADSDCLGPDARCENASCVISTPNTVCENAGQDGVTEAGLCDMSGNVAEWTADHWHPDYDCTMGSDCSRSEADRPTDTSPWLEDGTAWDKHVVRGGSFRSVASRATVHTRAPKGSMAPRSALGTVGFRMARTAPPNPAQ